MDSELVELVAEAIYRHDGGVTDEDYLRETGKPRRAWKTDKPWDSDPEHELCEWARDDYRMQAEAAIEIVSARIGQAERVCIDMAEMAYGRLPEAWTIALAEYKTRQEWHRRDEADRIRAEAAEAALAVALVRAEKAEKERDELISNKISGP
jgi:hypothetical protein